MKFDFKGRSRMIFALLAGFVFVGVTIAFPKLNIAEEQKLMVLGLLGAYILGEGLSGKTVNDSLKTILKSQKFQVLIAGLIMTVVKGYFPDLKISDTELLTLVGTGMAFIIGAGAEKTPATKDAQPAQN